MIIYICILFCEIFGVFFKIIGNFKYGVSGGVGGGGGVWDFLYIIWGEGLLYDIVMLE